MSEGEEDSTPNSATPLPSLDQDLDQDEEWTEFSGPVQDLPVDSGLLDYFKLFFFDSVLNMIVEETNRYMQTNIPELSLISPSDPYWRVPAIADIWGRQSYQKIHHEFHLADSSHQPGRNEGYDPLNKVRPLLDHIRNVCSSVYKPKHNLSQKPGEVRMRQKGRMVAVQWTDKRRVNILSTKADPKMVTVERRTKAGVVQVQVPKPVVQYNKAMFGVDE
ncbi:hypothetical protein RRG08_061679 [Elysia crispata]|uniref:PiggyBac transposable element-derived protein domain-containing protein n=1 Tax=Elysia crispata TaxID=231223 RepID=A0AAE1DF89_9GAST|nr:hypothetical protein RRG08_061679 [Elysia crispata]